MLVPPEGDNVCMESTRTCNGLMGSTVDTLASEPAGEPASLGDTPNKSATSGADCGHSESADPRMEGTQAQTIEENVCLESVQAGVGLVDVSNAAPPFKCAKEVHDAWHADSESPAPSAGPGISELGTPRLEQHCAESVAPCVSQIIAGSVTEAGPESSSADPVRSESMLVPPQSSSQEASRSSLKAQQSAAPSDGCAFAGESMELEALGMMPQGASKSRSCLDPVVRSGWADEGGDHPTCEGVPNKGVPNDGVPNEGVPNDGVPNEGVPNDGVPNILRPSNATVALVFGREESGLTGEELAACSHACAIPTGRTQPSMNLSHSVAAVLAQLFERCCSRPSPINSTVLSSSPQSPGRRSILEGSEGFSSSIGGSGDADAILPRDTSTDSALGTSSREGSPSTTLDVSQLAATVLTLQNEREHPAGSVAADDVRAITLNESGKCNQWGGAVTWEMEGTSSGLPVSGRGWKQQPASHGELEALFVRLRAIAQAVGMQCAPASSCRS
jgi:hypothetical protein